MKKIVLFFLTLVPSLSFGQLSPSIKNYNGEIETVVEKTYGKEVYLFNRWTGIYLPRCYSGWKYVYHLDSIGRPDRIINTFKGKLMADYIYEYFSSKNVTRKREIQNDTVNNLKGNYIEYEYLLDPNGKIEKLNYWSFHSADSSKKIFAVEEDIKYDSLNNITSYYSHRFDQNGKETTGKLYLIFYSNKSRVTREEENATGFKTVIVDSGNNTNTFKEIPISKPELLREWIYQYNSIGLLVSYTTKYYGELYKVDSNCKYPLFPTS